MKTKNVGNFIELSSETGYIHKIGTENYFKKGLIIDSVDNYEEVAEMPPYTKDEYDTKVNELVRERYTESEEFALQRKAINAAFSPSTLSADSSKALEEYAAYNTYVEQCKANAPAAIAADKERAQELSPEQPTETA